MGGPKASVVFGPTVALADVYWRLQAATGRGCWLPDDSAAKWRDTALAGSLLAFNRLVDETVERAPQIDAIRTAADFLVNPNLAVLVPKGRRAKLHHDTGGETQRKVDEQELEQGHVNDRKPEPKLGFGVDWTTRSPDSPPESPFLEYSAWISATNIGITNVRADMDLLHLTWSVNAREKLVRGFFAVASARSEEKSFEPGAWGGGVLWTVPRVSGWSVRADRKQTFDLNPVVTWTITLTGEQRTAVPRGILF